eukprot:TRINITY_DN25730_c0_g1_i1.p1 TRINITY_DN25730_c0_g1~~TRINITY_DN25730_c0_g1_i1.p1  ORF type:complete len:122 (-),score=55.61 TRINITY_DN25730_c0_g1_i1:19-384(-)
MANEGIRLCAQKNSDFGLVIEQGTIFGRDMYRKLEHGIGGMELNEKELFLIADVKGEGKGKVEYVPKDKEELVRKVGNGEYGLNGGMKGNGRSWERWMRENVNPTRVEYSASYSPFFSNSF